MAPINLSIPLSAAHLEGVYSAIITAHEQGCGYWLRRTGADMPADVVVPPWGDPDAEGKPMYPHHLAPLVGGTVNYRFAVLGDGTDVLRLDGKAVVRGLRLLAERDPRRLARVLEGDADSEDADVFMQLALLGDVVYG